MRKIRSGFLFLLGFGFGKYLGPFSGVPIALGALELYSGIQELHGESPFLLHVGTYLRPFAVLILFQVACAFVGVFPDLVAFISLLYSVFVFWISYCMIIGVREIEDHRNMDLKSKSIVKTWRVFVLTGICATVTGLLLKYMPDRVPDPVGVTGAISMLICVFSYFIYIMWVWNACSLYDGDTSWESVEEAQKKRETEQAEKKQEAYVHIGSVRMRRISAGLLLLLVRVNLFGFDWLPDFLGAYLLLKGVRELREDCPEFGDIERLLKCAVPIFAVIWVWNGVSIWSGNLMNNYLRDAYMNNQTIQAPQVWATVFQMMKAVTWLLRLVSTALTVSLLVYFGTRMWFLKAAGYEELNAKFLHTAFTLTAVVQVVYFLFEILLLYAEVTYDALSSLLLSVYFDLYDRGMNLNIWLSLLRQSVGLLLPLCFFLCTKNCDMVCKREEVNKQVEN